MKRLIPTLITCLLLLSACSSIGTNPASTPAPPTSKPPTPISTISDICPKAISNPNCTTPHTLRLAYGVQSLLDQGYSGKGQTIIDIVSYGSPTLQQDINVFDQQFHLPSITIQVISPLGTVPYNPINKDMSGWAVETELDVEIMHAIAPDAHIIVMTSPVDETEKSSFYGLPQFLQLEQYAVAHHLGQIFSESYVASEVTLCG